MNERNSFENVRSRRLPPLEAWKKPDKWIDLSTGLAKPHSSKLMLSTDERGFISPDEVVEQVEDMLFWKDYDWPYDVGDQETEPDDHHFYYYKTDYEPQSNGGNSIPSRFREIPTVKGTMPRQFHNAIHDFTKKPDMPEKDAMAEYYRSYMLAHRAFKNLIESAKNTAQASHMFTLRQNSLNSGGVTIPDTEDIVAQEIMRDFFAKHFDAYSRSVNNVMSLSELRMVLPEVQNVNQYKPHVVVKKLAKYVTRSTVNYTSMLRAV